MSIGKIFLNCIFALLITIASSGIVFGQSAPKPPREETLLNGLKVYILNDPSATEVSVKLRVHAGSAFDPQGKEGVMKLLSEAIFPSDEARQYFSEDLGGSFSVVSNFDYIQLNTASRTSSYIEQIETLANAVANPQLDKETLAAVRSRVISELEKREADPAYIADRIAAERLFGSFPYGRPRLGTTETLAKIDFADLRFAYARFFGADNATLTIRGNINSDEAYRAARRLFGSWLKSDKRVPSTFRQPDDPNSTLQVLNLRSDSGAEVRHVIRGYSYADADYPASLVLIAILETRLKKHAGVDPNARAYVRNEAHILPGSIVFGISGIAPELKVKLYSAGDSVDANSLIKLLLAAPITDSEFRVARSAVLADLAETGPDEIWLDAETYRFAPAVRARKYETVSTAEVQTLANGLRSRPAVNLWLVKGIDASGLNKGPGRKN